MRLYLTILTLTNQCSSQIYDTYALRSSNDMDYPLAWDNGDSYLGRTIFTTAADCCAVIEASGRSCEVIDECDVVAQDTMNVMKHTTTYKGQCGNKWHLDIEKPWACSNSKDFPDDWWLEEAVERMLHDTAESCCNEMFGRPDCDLFDECEEKVKTPCSEPTWYYDRDNNYCTNDGNYPVIWENAEVRDALLYKTKEECCEKNPTWQCNIHDFCNEWSEVTRD